MSDHTCAADGYAPIAYPYPDAGGDVEALAEMFDRLSVPSFIRPAIADWLRAATHATTPEET